MQRNDKTEKPATEHYCEMFLIVDELMTLDPDALPSVQEQRSEVAAFLFERWMSSLLDSSGKDDKHE